MDVDSHSHANVVDEDHGGEDVDGSHNLGVSSHPTTCFNYLILFRQYSVLCFVSDGSLFLTITIYNMTLDLWTLCVLSVGLITGYKNVSPQPVFETLNLKCDVNVEKSRSLCCLSLHNHYTTSLLTSQQKLLTFVKISYSIMQALHSLRWVLTLTTLYLDEGHLCSAFMEN